jgi:hypothetical protein
MTAKISHLSAYRPLPTGPCSCPNCLLKITAENLRQELRSGELFVPTDVLIDALGDIDAVLAHYAHLIEQRKARSESPAHQGENE